MAWARSCIVSTASIASRGCSARNIFIHRLATATTRAWMRSRTSKRIPHSSIRSIEGSRFLPSGPRRRRRRTCCCRRFRLAGSSGRSGCDIGGRRKQLSPIGFSKFGRLVAGLSKRNAETVVRIGAPHALMDRYANGYELCKSLSPVQKRHSEQGAPHRAACAPRRADVCQFGASDRQPILRQRRPQSGCRVGKRASAV